MYVRRGFTSGKGLGDPATMAAKMINKNTLQVTPEADFNHPFAMSDNSWGYGGVYMNRSLAENIILGYGHQWYSLPRPFIKDAKDSIESKGLHIKSLKKGLEKRLK